MDGTPDLWTFSPDLVCIELLPSYERLCFASLPQEALVEVQVLPNGSWGIA